VKAPLRLVGPLVVAALAAGPATAFAGTASVEGGVLRYHADPGEQNEISLLQRTGYIWVSDSGARSTTAGTGCEDFFGTVRCASDGLTRAEASGGDGDDVLHSSVDPSRTDGVPDPIRVVPVTLLGGDGADEIAISLPAGGAHADGGAGNDSLTGLDGDDELVGGDGNDILDGGDGADTLVGGAGEDFAAGGTGNDFIDVRDGQRDRVTCGHGRDRTRSDRFDSTPNLGDDFACDHSDIVRPAVLNVLVTERGTPGARPRLRIALELSKKACSGRVRLLQVGDFIGERTFRFTSGPRTRFRAGKRRKVVVHVRLSSLQRRVMRREEPDSFTFAVTLRDAAGRRSEQFPGF
jgi:RTX calcium-binding nonapeptide repeat (4 copies)